MDEQVKDAAAKMIVQMLQDDTPFAGFKRQIIKDRPRLREKFFYN